MSVSFSTALRNSRGQRIIDMLGSGFGPGRFEFYTAPKPAGGTAITTQVLLGTCVLSDPCGTVSGGATTFALINDDVAAAADGDIAWVRGSNGDGVWVLDMSAGLPGSGAEMIFDKLAARTGGIIKVLSGVLVEGNV